jgi:hypothetical protein
MITPLTQDVRGASVIISTIAGDDSSIEENIKKGVLTDCTQSKSQQEAWHLESQHNCCLKKCSAFGTGSNDTNLKAKPHTMSAVYKIEHRCV